MESYGKELILDLHQCDAGKFTRDWLKVFFSELCELIDMTPEDLHFWDDLDVPEDQRQTDPKTKGTSAVQFILTSTITIHTLDELQSVYVNIFSCKEFDEVKTQVFVTEFFDAKTCLSHVVVRT